MSNTLIFKSILRGSLALTASAVVACSLGCGMTSSIATAPRTTSPVSTNNTVLIQGNVHGGQQPVSGTTVRLYSAGTGGYGAGSTALGTAVTSGADGSFTVTGTYTCAPGSQVYILATGGNPGLAPTPPATTVNNTNLALMAALGTCPAAGNFVATIPTININEVTTVAAVYALQNFMAPPTGTAAVPSIGAPSTTYSNGLTVPTSYASGQIGMKNAFVTARVLADISLGVTPNTNYAYATPESAKINTIANVIATCVNSDPTQNTQCSTLLTPGTTGVVPTGSPAATDTIQAAWYMAQMPINNVAAVYALTTPISPFAGLAAAPKDWTVAVNYAPVLPTTTTPALAASLGVAVDAYGNVWTSMPGNVSVAELGVDGSLLLPPVKTYTVSATGGSTGQFTGAIPPVATSFTAPKFVAVDLGNNAWVANNDVLSGTVGTTATNTSTVAEFNGSTQAGVATVGGGSIKTGYFVGDLPSDIKIDGQNNVLVYNSAATSTTVLDGASLARMANDGTGYIWSTSSSTTAPNRAPGSAGYMALDNNTAATGGADGIAYVASSQACSVIGTVGVAATKWGSINEWNANNVTALTGSDAVSAFSGATVGPGSTTNCGSTSTSVGQVFNGNMSNVNGITADRFNNLWISNEFTSSTGYDGVTYITGPASTSGIFGSVYSAYDFTGSKPVAGVAPSTSGTTIRKSSTMAIDGNNNMWLTSETLGGVTEIGVNPTTGAFTFYTPGQNAVTGAGPFVHSISNATVASVAIDPSGNVWVSNNGAGTYIPQGGTATAPDTQSLTMIVGAAAPVITPVALALHANMVGQKP